MKKQKKVDFDEIKIKPKTLAIGIGIVVVALLVLAIVLAYGTKTPIGLRLKSTISRVAPMPVAIINYQHIISLSEVEKKLASVEQFYATQDLSQTGLRVDFSTPDGVKRLEIKKKDLLQKMLEDKAIELLANEKKIVISQNEVDKTVNQKLQEFGTVEEVKKDLEKSYGWSLADFKKQVILPSMYKDALVNYFNTNEAKTTQTKETIDKAKKELDGGKSFEQVVAAYSTGASKEKAGELGWVKKGQLLPELQAALFDNRQFKNDTVIESSVGFHIIEIENKKKDAGEDVVQIRQIFVAKYAFADWLAEKMNKMSIMLPFNEFRWNKANGVVEFRDQGMNEFEKNERAQAKGDASIIF